MESDISEMAHQEKQRAYLGQSGEACGTVLGVGSSWLSRPGAVIPVRNVNLPLNHHAVESARRAIVVLEMAGQASSEKEAAALRKSAVLALRSAIAALTVKAKRGEL